MTELVDVELITLGVTIELSVLVGGTTRESGGERRGPGTDEAIAVEEELSNRGVETVAVLEDEVADPGVDTATADEEGLADRGVETRVIKDKLTGTMEELAAVEDEDLAELAV